MTILYNDNDPYVAQWLGNLIETGCLPQGTVDARSINELSACDVAGYQQCHFFAGIGGWPYALELAGWDGPCWTASCPCQPLSSAGQRKGHADKRHLWPALYRLIAKCRPATIFGEQVASKDGREWLAGVRADLEQLGYAVGCADLPAACVGAPHIRQRLFWVSDSSDREHKERKGDAIVRSGRSEFSAGTGTNGSNGGLAVPTVAGRSEQPRRHDREDGRPEAEPGRLRNAERLGNAIGSRLEERSGERGDNESQRATAERDSSAVGGMGDAECQRRERWQGAAQGCVLDGAATGRQQGDDGSVGAYEAGFWSDAIWLPCLDGKARRTQPGIFPLADGVTGRVGKLCAAGNAIVPQVAAEFIKAFLECEGV